MGNATAVQLERITQCERGNECAQVVENTTNIVNIKEAQGDIKEDIKGVKADIKDIDKKMDYILLSVAGSVIIVLAQWLWQAYHK